MLPDEGKLRLIAVFEDSASFAKSPSTSLDISSRLFIQESCILSFNRILDERLRAWASRDVSTMLSDARTVDRLLCVDMEDCSKALDISSACTLRASSESR